MTYRFGYHSKLMWRNRDWIDAYLMWLALRDER